MFRMILGYGKNHQYARKHPYELGFRHNQRYSLVNVKLKWVKDRVLDTVVTGERELRAAWVIMSMIAVDPGGCLPIYRLSGRQRGPLGLPQDLKVSTFIRKFPNIFDEFHVPDSGGTLVPWFKLTADAITLNQEAIHVFQENQKDVLERVCKLLMLTRDMILPIATIDQLKWDLGLPFDYVDSFIPNYKDVFSLIRLSDDRVALKLLSWPKKLAEGFLGRSQGLYKKQVAVNSSGKDELYQVSEAESCENGFESEEESKDHIVASSSEVGVRPVDGVWPCPFRRFHCCPDGMAGSKGFPRLIAHIKRLRLSSDDRKKVLREAISTDPDLFAFVGEALKAFAVFIVGISKPHMGREVVLLGGLVVDDGLLDRVFLLPITTVMSIPPSCRMAFSHEDGFAEAIFAMVKLCLAGRLVSKAAMSGVGKKMAKYLGDFQFGVDVHSGAKAVLHSANIFINKFHSDGSLAMLTVDFSNAFNLVSRTSLLHEVWTRCPSISL
ncbi:hypothetical protein E3N88_08003 [Mikania micrantha]|uniref:PORR domain-containing protein n=1 Tax=Mikania micrantha TaxID=192012 RepID=A0A5N6PG30_9ASTR|nr:hypothetical protein E3N88_08003 [Mikania micrantha]